MLLLLYLSPPLQVSNLPEGLKPGQLLHIFLTISFLTYTYEAMTRCNFLMARHL